MRTGYEVAFEISVCPELQYIVIYKPIRLLILVIFTMLLLIIPCFDVDSGRAVL